MSAPIAEGARDRTDTAGTRCNILSIAERLFREIGYRKTTVADIAKSLRMSPANVYRFFDSKKAINEAVAERIMGDMEAELSTIVTRPDSSASDRLAEFLRTQNRLTVERLVAERRMHEMVECAMSESWNVVQRHIARVDNMLCRLMADGARSGEFRVADPMLAARCVHCAIVRFCHPALIVQCADEPGPGIEDMITFVLRGLRT